MQPLNTDENLDPVTIEISAETKYDSNLWKVIILITFTFLPSYCGEDIFTIERHYPNKLDSFMNDVGQS